MPGTRFSASLTLADLPDEKVSLLEREMTTALGAETSPRVRRELEAVLAR